MSAGRAERRRAARVHAREAIIIGADQGGARMVAEGTGQVARATPGATMPDKVPGKHRWIVTAAWVVDDELATAALDERGRNLLDNRALFDLGVGCWDCEQPLGDGRPGTIVVGSVCPAAGDS